MRWNWFEGSTLSGHINKVRPGVFLEPSGLVTLCDGAMMKPSATSAWFCHVRHTIMVSYTSAVLMSLLGIE